LTHLMEREDGPFVARLAREPGRRDSRYAHLFSGEIESAPQAVATVPVEPRPRDPVGVGVPAAEPDRLARLEGEIRAIRQELDELKCRIGGEVSE